MNKTLTKVVFSSYLYGGAILLIAIILGIGGFLLRRGGLILGELNTHNSWFKTLVNIVSDLWPSIAGTFLITGAAVLIAVPLGIITAIFINEYTTGAMRETYTFLFKLISGVPSIVIGVFGFVSLITINSIFNMNLKTSFIVSAFSLSLLILPYIIQSTILALQEVPKEIRIAAQSLGAKKYQNIFLVLLPQSFVPLSSGIILAIGRACEDTAVIMLTGVAAYAGLPNSLTSSFEALPFYIYYHTAEYQNQYELTSVFVATIIIVMLSTAFMMIASFLRHKINLTLNG